MKDYVIPLNKSINLLKSIWNKDISRFKELVGDLNINGLLMQYPVVLNPDDYVPVSQGIKLVTEVLTEHNFLEVAQR